MLRQLKKDLETWQTLQETTTKLLGASLLLIDSQGEPVTEITNACLFCETARSKEVCLQSCLLYTSPSPRDGLLSRMPSSA